MEWLPLITTILIGLIFIASVYAVACLLDIAESSMQQSLDVKQLLKVMLEGEQKVKVTNPTDDPPRVQKVRIEDSVAGHPRPIKVEIAESIPMKVEAGYGGLEVSVQGQVSVGNIVDVREYREPSHFPEV